MQCWTSEPKKFLGSFQVCHGLDQVDETASHHGVEGHIHHVRLATGDAEGLTPRAQRNELPKELPKESYGSHVFAAFLSLPLWCDHGKVHSPPTPSLWLGSFPWLPSTGLPRNEKQNNARQLSRHCPSHLQLRLEILMQLLLSNWKCRMHPIYPSILNAYLDACTYTVYISISREGRERKPQAKANPLSLVF